MKSNKSYNDMLESFNTVVNMLTRIDLPVRVDNEEQFRSAIYCIAKNGLDYYDNMIDFEPFENSDTAKARIIIYKYTLRGIINFIKDLDGCNRIADASKRIIEIFDGSKTSRIGREEFSQWEVNCSMPVNHRRFIEERFNNALEMNKDSD